MKKKANKTIGQLRRFESRNVTFIEPDGSWPIVWERAKGMRVWDDDGREYLDFTAAFAVAAAGHANPRIVAAGRRQMAKLLHAMGDVHPHALKAELARELSRLTFERLAKRIGKTIFCNSGFEAVEAALKTAHLATGRTRVIAFEDAYHGLGYGALNATWRSDFRSPFRRQIGGFASFVPFPRVRADLAKLEQRLAAEFRKRNVGAILVEPIQGRGGTNIPPPGFLKLLHNVCNKHGALLICDEVYTGFGRTGRWFASEHFGVTPLVVRDANVDLGIKILVERPEQVGSDRLVDAVGAHIRHKLSAPLTNHIRELQYPQVPQGTGRISYIFHSGLPPIRSRLPGPQASRAPKGCSWARKCRPRIPPGFPERRRPTYRRGSQYCARHTADRTALRWWATWKR